MGHKSWVSNMLLGTDEDFQDSPDRGSPLNGGCHDIVHKAWPWTIVGNIFEVDHAPGTLKTSFVDLEKR